MRTTPAGAVPGMALVAFIAAGRVTAAGNGAPSGSGAPPGGGPPPSAAAAAAPLGLIALSTESRVRR